MNSTDASIRRALFLLIVAGAMVCVAAAESEAPFILFDADGDPVPHARVTVVGRSGSVTTDANGRFLLSPHPTPPFEIAVFDETGVWLGKQRVEQLAAEGPSRIYLPPATEVEVSVHGGVAPSTHAPPAAAATVISRNDNISRPTTQLYDVLKDVPSTTQVGGGHAAVPSLRGLARGRTLLLIDEGQVTSERRAGPSATFLDPFTVENVEVVRGPGSVYYGSDAMGGVIHMTTPVPSAERLSTRFEFGAGIGLEYGGGAAEVNIPMGNGGMLIQAHARDYDNYESPEGVVPTSFSSDYGYLIKGLIPTGKMRWVVGFQSDRVAETGKPVTGSPETITTYPDEESDRLTVGADLPGPGGFQTMALRLFAGNYRLVTDREDLPTATRDREIFRSDIDANDALLRLVATRALPRGSLRLGFDMRSRFDLEATNTLFEFDSQDNPTGSVDEIAIADARRIDTGLFAEWERVLSSKSSSVSLGLRAQHSSTRNRGGQAGDQSSSDGKLTGYFAYTLRPAEPWTVAMQLAQGFREPTLSSLYFTGVTGRGFIEGNPDLEPETSRQFDVSFQRSGQLVHFAAYTYYYRILDLVERYRRPDGIFSWRNRDEEELYGIELEADINLGKAFSARLMLSAARGTILDDNSPAADVPPLSGGFSFQHRPTERLWWRFGLRLVAWDNLPGPTETTTPAYGVVDLSTGWTLTKGLEARLILGNILDKAYPASAADDSVLATGRSAALVLAGDF